MAGSLALLHLVLPGVLGPEPSLLVLEHPVVSVESILLFFKGDSFVATQVSSLPPNLHIGTRVDVEGGGVLGSSGAVPSSIATLALTLVMFVELEVVVFLNKYFIVFVSLFPRTN